MERKVRLLAKVLLRYYTDGYILDHFFVLEQLFKYYGEETFIAAKKVAAEMYREQHPKSVV